MSQEDLLSMINNKDARAFTFLYDMYSRSLFAVISNLIPERDQAQHVLQETFVKIWMDIDSYDETKGRFFTWALSVARHAAADSVRSKGNTGQRNLPSDNFVRLIQANRTADLIDAIGVRDFVKKLKPKCVQIIELLFFKGYTQQQASDELEIPIATVNTQNRNCINDLRNFLQI